MASESANQDLVVRIRGDNSELIKSLQDAGVKVNEFGGKTKEAGSIGHAGMQMISMSAQQAALSLGLPGPVAQKLGGELDNVVASFGRFAKGVGVATVVIALAATAYNKYIDYKRHEREELEKSVNGIKGEVMALYDSAGVSDKARKATYDLTLAKRDLLRVESALLLVSWNEQLKEEAENLQEVGSKLEWMKRVAEAARYSFAGMLAPDFTDRMKSLSGEYFDKQSAEVGVLEAKVKLLETMIERISGKAPSLDSTVYTDIEKYKDKIEALRASMEVHRIQGRLSGEQYLKEQLDIFDMESKLHEMSLIKTKGFESSKEEVEQYYYTRGLIRKKKDIEGHRALEVQKWNNTSTILSGLSGLMDQFYSASGSKAKAFFYISRGLAAAEAFVNYQAKASYEANQNNESMATYYRVMSIAVPAAIIAQTFAGTSGSDPGGAGVTSSASVTEGLPATTEKSQEINIWINGVQTDVPQLTEKIVREIGRNNGSVGGFQVGVSGTA